jgi:peptidoglycan-associated lipoprotein
LIIFGDFMKKFLGLFALVVLLSACASGVKLNEVPVEDKSGASVSVAPDPVKPAADSSSTNEAKSSVVPVDTSSAVNLSAGPAGNVSKVVFFDYDSYSVKPEFQSTIAAHAQFLKANPKAKVSLEGHTDERGGREYNLALGQKRADAVRQALSLLGVADSQVESVSFGKEKPAAQGADESAFAKNRRAEFFYR